MSLDHIYFLLLGSSGHYQLLGTCISIRYTYLLRTCPSVPGGGGLLPIRPPFNERMVDEADGEHVRGLACSRFHPQAAKGEHSPSPVHTAPQTLRGAGAGMFLWPPGRFSCPEPFPARSSPEKGGGSTMQSFQSRSSLEGLTLPPRPWGLPKFLCPARRRSHQSPPEFCWRLGSELGSASSVSPFSVCLSDCLFLLSACFRSSVAEFGGGGRCAVWWMALDGEPLCT